jgi:hypothetical protein
MQSDKLTADTGMTPTEYCIINSVAGCFQYIYNTIWNPVTLRCTLFNAGIAFLEMRRISESELCGVEYSSYKNELLKS